MQIFNKLQTNKTYQKRFTTLNFLYFQNMHTKIHLKEKIEQQKFITVLPVRSTQLKLTD